MEINNVIDYYKVLQVDRAASTDEIKRSYQRLILTFHPDKSATDTEESFLLIQKAWSALRDPESRKLYDATLTCQEHAEILLYDTILLSDMSVDSENEVYMYDCRCGGTYVIEASAIHQARTVIGCDECSFSIQVNR